MRRIAVVATIGAVAALVSACGGAERSTRTATEPGIADATPTIVRHEHGAVTRMYEVGTAIQPGVYTSTTLGCVGIAASTAKYDAVTSDDDDAIVGESSRVGDLQRIEVHDGEFFDVDNCAWQREDPARPTTPDPATVAGACTILMGPDALVGTTLAFAKKPGADAAPPSALQDKLMAVVFARTKGLADSAGQLVDLLDDPAAYVDDGTLDSKVTGAASKIRAVCRGR